MVCRYRRIIPDKEALELRLNALMTKDWPDEHGVSLLTEATEQAHERALKIVREGRVSGELSPCST